jgi:hypothetical protein
VAIYIDFQDRKMMPIVLCVEAIVKQHHEIADGFSR